MRVATASLGGDDPDPGDRAAVEVAQPDRGQRKPDRHDEQDAGGRDERPRPDPVEELAPGDEQPVPAQARAGPPRPPASAAVTGGPLASAAHEAAPVWAGARSSASPGRTPTRSMKISSSDGSAISNRATRSPRSMTARRIAWGSTPRGTVSST